MFSTSLSSWLPPSVDAGAAQGQADNPLLTTVVRDKEACADDYQQLCQTSQYPSATALSSSWTLAVGSFFSLAPRTAEEVCLQYYLSRPSSLPQHVGRLCVVTGVCLDSAALVVATELALSAGRHVILLGRHAHQVQACRQVILEQARQRGLSTSRDICVYANTPKYYLASLESIRQAAEHVKRIAQRPEYKHQLDLVVHMARVGSATAKLTDNGLLEYNMGCNFIGTHYFTQLLMPLLLQSTTSNNNNNSTIHSPRIVYANSMGHCLGTNVRIDRLVQFPQQGGAPPGFLQSTKRQHLPHTSLLASDETITLNQSDEPQSSETMLTEEFRRAVQKRGTQVGRSYMALLASMYHTARLHHPRLTCVAFHMSNSASADHAAMPALRAALDDQLSAPDCTIRCWYLHSDGRPWTPMEPATDPAFGQACFEAAQALLQQEQQQNLPTTTTATPSSRMSLLLEVVPCVSSDTVNDKAVGYQPPSLIFKPKVQPTTSNLVSPRRNMRR